MKTGDLIQDAKGVRYQVGLMLGQGLWGRSFKVRRESDQAEFVLKTSLEISDLPPGLAGLERVVAGCREIAAEQVTLLSKASLPFLPRLEASFDGPTGAPCLLLQACAATLEARLQARAPFSETVDILGSLVGILTGLPAELGIHGNLAPSNILLDERGKVLLTDFATPAFRRLLPRLLEAAGREHARFAPEIPASGAGAFSSSTDGYAVGMILWRAAMGEDDYRPWPREGLDKAGLVSLKDHLHERLKQEQANPRFHARLAERLAATVNRAISRQADPSPPYRFTRFDELGARVGELASLIHPGVTSVGRIVFEKIPTSNVFLTNEAVRFSASVGCSVGVDGADEIACGIAVFDRETNERVRAVECGFSVDKHPSGRFRFSFEMQPPNPGSYKVRLAFAILGPGQEPLTREADFEVRAAPGYTPPRESPSPKPLPLTPEPEVQAVTLVGPKPAPAVPEPSISSEDLPRPVQPAPLPPVPSRNLAPPPARPTPSALVEPAKVQPADPSVKATRPAPVRIPTPGPEPQRVSSSAVRPRPEPTPPAAPPRPAPEPEAPRPQAPPARTNGYWSDLPLPPSAEEDLWEDESPRSGGPARFQLFYQRIVDFVRGDAYVLFMVGAGILICVLVIALFVLRG